jgi:hypothetical protein
MYIKWTWLAHGLYVFWKEIHSNLHIFFNKISILQFNGNFMIPMHITEQVLDQIVCISGFHMYSLFECHG